MNLPIIKYCKITTMGKSSCTSKVLNDQRMTGNVHEKWRFIAGKMGMIWELDGFSRIEWGSSELAVDSWKDPPAQ